MPTTALDAGTAAFVAAGLVSALAFPALATALLRSSAERAPVMVR